MQILVLDAANPIGLAVSKALSRAGHTVYGQTQIPEEVNSLDSEEITSVLSDHGAAPNSWLEYVRSVHIVIDATSVASGTQTAASDRFRAVVEEAENHRSPDIARLVFIHTSYAWIEPEAGHINGPDAQVQNNEWSDAYEDAVLKGSEHVNGIVVRSAFVYGYDGALMESWLSEAIAANDEGRKMAVTGPRDERLSLVHIDDLTELYVLAVSKVHLCARHVLDVTSNDSTTVSAKEVLSKMKQIARVDKGYHYRKVDMHETRSSMTSRTLDRMDACLRLDDLGWKPCKSSFIQRMAVYYAAVKARWLRSRDDALSKGLADRITELQERIKTLEAQLAEKDSLNSGLTTDVADIRARFENQIADLRTSIAVKEKEITSLRAVSLKTSTDIQEYLKNIEGLLIRAKSETSDAMSRLEQQRSDIQIYEQTTEFQREMHSSYSSNGDLSVVAQHIETKNTRQEEANP